MRVDWDNPISDDPLNTGLVSRWQVGEDNPYWGGPKFYDLAGLNHGTLTGFDPAVNPWSGPLGRPGGYGALSFDGSNDYVNIPDATALNPTTITLIANVFDTSAIAGYRGLMMKRNDSLSNRAAWAFDRNNDVTLQEFRFYFNTGGNWNIWTSNGLGHLQNAWEQIAVTYDAAGPPKFYRNGVLASSSPTVVLGSGNPSLPSNTEAVGIGWYPTGSGNDFSWLGLLDNACIWNRALTAGEVFGVYETSRQQYDPTLNWIKPRKYFFVDAGGGGTFNASWARYSNILIQPGAA